MMTNRLHRALIAGLALALAGVAPTALAAPTAASLARLAGLRADGSISRDVLASAVPRTGKLGSKGTPKAYDGLKSSVASGVPGIDSIPNWVGSFTAPGYDSNGNPQSVWPFEMVGQAPESNRTTLIRAPIVPVTLELLDATGQVARASNGAPLRNVVPGSVVTAVVQSPLFQPFRYFTGTTQFNDAELRSEFWNRLPHDGDGGWHTLLYPQVVRTRTVQLPLGTYAYGLNADGTCCEFVLADADTFGNSLFPTTYPFDNSTPIGAAENAGDMTTRDISTLLFNNVFLVDSSGGCCIIGFHTYDFEPGTTRNGNRPRIYVVNYSSWITPGLFSGGFQDITALSHEMSETFNDPFIDNATPWWLSVDPFFGYANCQNNLETGDVIEVLASNTVFPIQMNGMTYHPQNEALFSWFAFQSPSRAQNGSYSFPDESTLTSLSPGPLLPGCVPAP